MCNFFSFLLFRTGEVFYHPLTNLHEDLIALRGLSDLPDSLETFARVEVLPPVNLGTIEDLDSWIVGSNSKPDWFYDALDKGRRAIYGVLERSLIKDSREALVGGIYVLLKGSSVRYLTHCNIPLVIKESQVGSAEYCQFGRVYGSIKTLRCCRIGYLSDKNLIGQSEYCLITGQTRSFLISS